MDDEAVAQAQAAQLAELRRQLDADVTSNFLAQDDEAIGVEADKSSSRVPSTKRKISRAAARRAAASGQENGTMPDVMRREMFSQPSPGSGSRLQPRSSTTKSTKRGADVARAVDADTAVVVKPKATNKKPRIAPAKPKPPPSNSKARRREKRKSVTRKSYAELGEEEPAPDDLDPNDFSRSSARASDAHNSDVDMNFTGVDGGNGRKQFVIGLDYGTTFTSVSYYAYPENEDSPQALPSDIKSIVNWPEDGMGGMRRQVPTACWYSTTPMTRLLPPDQYEIGEWDDRPGVVGHSTRPVTTSRGANNRPHHQSSDDEDDQVSTEFLWGYEVPYHRYEENAVRPRDEIRCIERAKLMLVDTEHTREDRERLRPRLNHLIEQGLIRKFGKRFLPDERDVQDTISDFLIEVFRHTKQQLAELEGLTGDCKVSFVMTVPAIWSPRSSRILQYAMEAAVRSTGLGTLGHGSVDNLFIITEPEAAATYLLRKSHDMIAGETFVVLDCGGGTVDGVTYTATDSYPLRLKAEVGRPTGDNCGASYLNVNFEKHVLGRLAGEHYLDRKSHNRQSIVRALVPNFENHIKRKIEISGNKSSRLRVPGLLQDMSSANGKRNLENDYLKLDADDYRAIFTPLLLRVGAVLRNQMDMAMEKRKPVKKVFLIGGFGAAPSLRTFMKRSLEDFEKKFNLPYEIRLITTNDQESVTAVASGAVLRALNKQQGPTREAYSSFGFLRVEPYAPKHFVGHRRAEPLVDEVDGEKYVTVIDYFIQKGTVIPSMHVFPPYSTYHTFEVDEPLFLCEEVLYVSDIATESHYALTDPRNRDAQVAGKIIVDMTFLRDENKIQPVLPPPGPHGVVHYRVEYDLVAVVEGRNLRYEARYPANSSGTVHQVGQISIAAAFRPGTG